MKTNTNENIQDGTIRDYIIAPVVHLPDLIRTDAVIIEIVRLRRADRNLEHISERAFGHTGTSKSSIALQSATVHAEARMTFTLLLLCIGIGVVAGLRSMTAPAAVAWAAHLGWFNLYNSALAFVGSTIATYLLSAGAVIELIADKLPSTPARTAPIGLGARLVNGAFSAAVLSAAAGQSVVVGVICGVLGAMGAMAGAFGGYHLRHRLVRNLHLPDFVIAVTEDAVAIAGAFFLVSRM
jgi:uncharacterized membrane protein